MPLLPLSHSSDTVLAVPTANPHRKRRKRFIRRPLGADCINSHGRTLQYLRLHLDRPINIFSSGLNLWCYENYGGFAEASQPHFSQAAPSFVWRLSRRRLFNN